MPTKPIPVFIDFEASSLSPASYPIEVAWNVDQSVEQHLISPQSVSHWIDWDMQSEALHGIARAEWVAHGEASSWVCQRLNERLKDPVAYSDHPLAEAQWPEELFSVCPGRAPAFRIGDFDELLDALEPTAREYASMEFEGRIEELKQTWSGAHRAGRDGEYRMRVYLTAESVIEAFSVSSADDSRG